MPRITANGHQHVAEVRMPAALWRRLKAAAAAHQTSVSEILREGARRMLENMGARDTPMAK